jgi:hypothetical protein
MALFSAPQHFIFPQSRFNLNVDLLRSRLVFRLAVQGLCTVRFLLLDARQVIAAKAVPAVSLRSCKDCALEKVNDTIKLA